MTKSIWEPRPRSRRGTFGYIPYKQYLEEGGDPSLSSSLSPEEIETYDFPSPVITAFLDETFDLMESGTSLREAADFLRAKCEEIGIPHISHMGLSQIRKRYRPDFVRQRENVQKKRMSRLERTVYNRKRKIARDKNRLTTTEKRIRKREQELSELVNDDKRTIFEIPEEEYDYESIPQEEVIIFKPNPGPQTTFLAAPEREVLYGGAAGGGKSYALLVDPMRYFGSRSFNGLILRRTNDELRELIWKSRELYPPAFPGSQWSEKKSSWTFPSGGHLWFTYLERDEDVMRYQGQAFTWIGFDELTQYPTPFPWDYLRSRLRTVDPELQKTLSMRATTNPGGPGHGWVKKMFIDPAPPGKPFAATDIDTGEPLVFPEYHARAGEPLFQRRFIPAKVSDNPYLWEDGTYEANLLSLPEAQQRRLLYGDWDVADGAAFSEFRQSLHVCEPFEIDDSWFKFRSCDFGYSERQASAVHWYAVEPSTGCLYVYRELYVNKHTGQELAKKILKLEAGERIAYGVLDSSVWAVRGQTGPSIAEEMIRAGCKWKPSDRSPGSRIASKNRLHELLKVDKLTEKPGIIFFDTCRQIIADLPVIPMSKDDDDIDKKYASDHAYDSIRYGIQSRPKMFYYNDSRPYSVSHSVSDPTFGY